MASFVERLKHYNDAAYPALWIQTFEEARITKEITSGMFRKPTAGDPGCRVFQWDSQDGLTERTDGRVKEYKDTDDPIKLFKQIKALVANEPSVNIFILKDFHLQFTKPLKHIDYIRAFKNILEILKVHGNMVLITAPVVKIPTELQKDIQLIDYQLPNTESIATKLTEVANEVNQSRKGKDKIELDDSVKEASIEAAKGMTASEIENAFAFAIVENKAFNASFVKSVFNEKILQVKKGGMLNHIETDVSFDNVGGLDGIKRWVQTRKNAFSKEARDYGLPYPKGLGLAGIAGCGKTLISKAIANEFRFPLFQLDLGGLFSKYVGETEGNFIQMTKTVDSIGRCVILIDEIEKYLNVSATSGAGDSGTSSRSFGTLLSWLSDRNNPAFVIFTSNNHLALPVELIRKGRFDELFWIDLPDERERRDVINVVINKFKRNVSKFDINELVRRTADFTGAEIDNVFKDAMFAAFSEGKEVDQSYLVKEIMALTPQSKINAEAIEAMRARVEGRLKPAVFNTSAKSYLTEVRKSKHNEYTG